MTSKRDPRLMPKEGDVLADNTHNIKVLRIVDRPGKFSITYAKWCHGEKPHRGRSYSCWAEQWRRMAGRCQVAHVAEAR